MVTLHLFRTSGLLSCLLLALGALPTPRLDAQATRKLNGPLASSFSGDVLGFQLSPDGVHALAFLDPGAGAPRRFERWHIDGSGSPVVLVEASDQRSPMYPFVLAPDGSRLVYVSYETGLGPAALYSVRCDGSAAPVRLTPPFGTNGGIQLGSSIPLGPWITDGGLRVLYHADAEVNEQWELWSVPIDGSAPPVRVSSPLAPNVAFGAVALSPDGSEVAFVARTAAGSELYVAPTDGSRAPLRLDAPTISSPFIPYATYTSDGATVVYSGVETESGRYHLFSVRADGSAPPTQLVSGPESVNTFELTPDGKRALLLKGSSGLRLWSVPVDGSAPPLELSGPFVAGGSIGDGGEDRIFQSPDGHWVAFVADKDTVDVNELYVVPVDGSAAPRKLSGPMVAYGDVGPTVFPYTPLSSAPFTAVAVTPDGSRVLYIADQETDGLTELWSVPIDGSAAPVSVSDVPDGVGGGVAFLFRFSPDGTRVVFQGSRHASGVVEVWSAPVDGSADPVRIDRLPVPGGDVTGTYSSFFDVAGDGTVVYSADQDVNDTVELFSAPLAGGVEPVRLNPPFPGGGTAGDVLQSQVSPDGRFAVYVATEERANVAELFSASLDDPLPRVKLSQALDVEGGIASFRITPDSTRVVYRLQLATGSYFGNGRLFCVPIDGSAPPVLVSGPITTVFDDYSVDPSSTRVVFRDTPGVVAYNYLLHSAPLDKSSAPVELSGLPVGLVQLVSAYGFSSGGQEVLFLRRGTGRDELYVATIDGSHPAVLLSGTSQSSGNVTDFRVPADDRFVIFRGDLLADERYELFRAPLDASAGRVRVSDPVLGSTAGRSVERDFALTPDGLAVVYRADRDANDVLELYCGPSDGSDLPIELNPPLEGALFKDVLDFALTPDGAHVVYRSNQDNPATIELFRVSRAGGPAVRLSEPFLPHGAIKGVQPGYAVASAGRVVYLSDQDVEDEMRLWSAPADGSSPALRLETAPPGGGVIDFLLRGQGERAFFRRTAGSRTELFSVRTDGAWGPVRVSPPLADGRAVGPYSVSVDGRRVVYVADQETDDVQELFLSLLGSGDKKQQAPTPSRMVQR